MGEFDGLSPKETLLYLHQQHRFDEMVFTAWSSDEMIKSLLEIGNEDKDFRAAFTLASRRIMDIILAHPIGHSAFKTALCAAGLGNLYEITRVRYEMDGVIIAEDLAMAWGNDVPAEEIMQTAEEYLWMTGGGQVVRREGNNAQ